MISKARGFDQHYEDFGQGIPLLCLPAFPFDSRMYREQRTLAGAARLILPDYRGTGKSGPTAGPSTMELLAADMVGLLDALHISQAVVLGVSLGGYVALAMQAQFPQRLLGLVLADTRAEADTPEAAQRRLQTVARLRSEGPQVLGERISDLFGEHTQREHPELVAEFQAQLGQGSAEGFAQLALGLAQRPDRRTLLPSIQTPALVLCGEEDRVAPPAVAEVLAAAIPQAKFHLIPKAGHLSPLENPRSFNHLVEEFLISLSNH